MTASFGSSSNVPLPPTPRPPVFMPRDRFITPGDCMAKGHVYQAQSHGSWRCVSCGNIYAEVRINHDSTTPQHDFPRPLHYAHPDLRSTTQPCLWDNLSPEDRGKPMGLSCPCPRCSPHC